MLDKLFFVVLVLSATGIFRFVAFGLHVDIKYVSIVLLGVNALYLLARWRGLVLVLRRPTLRFLLFVLFLWPVMTAIYAPVLDVRDIGLQIYYASLLFSAAVFGVSKGCKALHRVVAVSLVVGVAGILLSLVEPAYFAGVAKLADASSSYLGRGYGFLLQPNMAAASLVLLFVGWYSLFRRKESFLGIGVLLVFLALVLSTGSRINTFIAIIVCVLILASKWRDSMKHGYAHLMSVSLIYAVLAACLLVGVIWVHGYAVSRQGGHNVFSRIATLTDFEVAKGGITNDESFRLRREGQGLYWGLIQERPFLGYGVGSEDYYRADGQLYIASHSDLLSTWLKYGIFWPFVFYVVMISAFHTARRLKVEKALGTNSVWQFFLITCLLFAVDNTIMNLRAFYVVWGLIFVALPQAQMRFCRRSVTESDEGRVGNPNGENVLDSFHS